MNTKRVLLGCTVISLQDTRFVYPCCKVCLCKVTAESNSRSRCPKCGFTSDAQKVDYRFRLSLKVSRDSRLFGVTVFGGCLNPFFGIQAGDLQRFVESETFNGPQSLQQLLIKAVEDCFIGKCLVFGFKLSCSDAESCLVGEHAADESAQFVACQVIPPHGALLGITVFAYLQNLMQVNTPAECFPNAGCWWQKKDSLLGSFDHTLPLCQRSASGNDSLTIAPPWNLVSNLDLCFSPEKTSECSLPEVSAGNSDSHESLVSQWPNGQRAEISPFKLSESKPTKHKRSSTFYRSSFNSSFISPIKTTPSVHPSKHLPSNQWAVEKCFSQMDQNESFSEKHLFNHTSFALEDAPLSETLGDFVSTKWQIVNQQVLSSSTCKGITDAPENNDRLENNTVLINPPVALPLLSPVSVLTPLRDITNDEKSLKRKKGKRKSFLASEQTMKLSHVSKCLLSCDIKSVVSNRNKGTPVHNHARKKRENQSIANEDAYNCSADLFHVAESSFFDADPRKQEGFEPNNSSFHFAPSVQSTPIVDPLNQCTYRQRKLSKYLSRKSFTHTNPIKVLHTNNSQELLVKPNFNRTLNSALKNFESLSGGSKVNANMQHTSGNSASFTITNDCSRDLFD